jgi:amino acid adenylation domain-containing protein
MIIKTFEEQVQKSRDKIALKMENQALTYGELDQCGSRVATAINETLARENRDTQPVVALLFQHGCDMIIGLIGALKANTIYVPLDRTHPETRLVYMLEDAGASLVLTDTQNLPLAESLRKKTGQNIEIMDICSIYPDRPQPGETPRRQVYYREPAYILYTSGSTGKPKGVLQNHMNVMYYTRNWTEKFAITASDRMTLLTAFVHDGAVQDIWSALHNGASLYPYDVKNILERTALPEFIAKEQITIWHSVPTLFRYFTDSLNSLPSGPGPSAKDFLYLRFILLGGEPLRKRDIDILKLYFPHARLANVYGQTESSVDSIAIYKPGDSFGLPILGEPLDKTTILLVNEEDEIVEDIGVGEIVIACDHIAPGYWKDPEKTEEKFTRDPELGKLYWTGDLGGMKANGDIEVLGRKDFQIKIRGFRVEVGEIESVLLEYETVKEAMVVLKEDKQSAEYLCCYLVPEQPAAFDSEQMRQYLLHRLPDYMIPRVFIPMEKFPLTASGKIDKNALPQPGIEEKVQTLTPPANEIEKQLAETWHRELRVPLERIGRETHFFELGGHSLRAINLIAKIHQRFHVKLELEDIFTFPLLKELAQYIASKGEEIFRPINPAEEKEYYPLSPAQERLYILQEMEPQSTAYNLSDIISRPGQLDKQRLQQAVQHLVRRHHTFKTSFLIVNDVPVQKINETTESAIEFYRVEDETKARKIIKRFIRPFDLSTAPQFRLGVIELSENKHLILLDMHHIITDGISQVLFMQEFQRIYLEQELPPLKLQYKDYSQWQNSEQRLEEIKTRETYWLEQFSGEIPVLDLPSPYKRPPVQSFQGTNIRFALTAPETQELRNLAKQEDITLYMLILAIIDVFLFKLSGREDIVIGTPSAGRKHADLEHIIGIMVNTLALRNFPQHHKTFRGFLKEVRQQTLAAFKNQDYQFEKLVEKVSPHRNLSRNPLFDVMFALHNQAELPGSSPHLKNIEEIDSYRFAGIVSRFDLTIHGIEAGEILGFSWEYSTALFQQENIRKFFDYFKNTMTALLKNPDRVLANIEIITPEEKQQILLEFNDTAAHFTGPRTLHRWFEQQTEKTPDKIAVIGPSPLKYRSDMTHRTYISYKELNEQSNQLARLLRKKGAVPDSVIGLMTDPSIETVIAVLAILKAGSAYLPIEPKLPENRKKIIIKESFMSLLLINLPLGTPGYPAPQTIEIMNLNDKGLYVENNRPLENMNKPADLLYVIYTSGSTGIPKGVMVEHGNLVNLMKFHHRYTNLDCTRVTQFASISFDASFHEIFSTLLAGGTLYLLDKEVRTNIAELSRIIEKNNIKTTFLPISFLKTIFSEESDNAKFPGSLQHIQTAGEQVVVIDRFRQYLKENHVYLHNHYGPSETHVVTTLTLAPTGDIPDLPSIGKPVSNTQIYIVDPLYPSHLQPIGVTGELVIGGLQVGRGYLNNPELTAQKFQSNFMFHRSYSSYKSYILYRTGDLARWLPDGNIEFLGRADFQVKIRGFRVELEEIENCLLKVEGIKEAVVIDRLANDRDNDHYLCAYVVSEKPVDVSRLRDLLNLQLPDYMIPSYFVPLEKIPVKPSGKIDRGALPEPQITPPGQYTPPGNEIEQQLVQLWSQVLGIDINKISTTANFFQLGGHSLKATILVSKIHKALDIDVPLAEIFKTPTIKGLAGYIQQASTQKYQPIKPVMEQPYYPVSSAQKRLYILQQMEKDNFSYNMPIVVTLETVSGPIEKKKIADTFEKIIRRHESFRTSFELMVGEPVQVIHDNVDFQLEYHDLTTGERRQKTGSKPAIHLSSVIRHLSSEFIRPFDLSRAPLLRGGLIKLNDTTFILVLDMHHVICDGTSRGIFIKDFAALYNDRELPPPNLRYRDYACWLNHPLQQKKIKQQEIYWIKQFSEEIPLLNLPIDFPRPPVRNFDGTHIDFILDEPATRALNALALEKEVTLFMLLTAVFNVLMSKLSSQEVIVIGTPSASRHHADLEEIIGMFANTLALQNYPNSEKSFARFLQEVKQQTLEAFANQDYPFEDLVDKVVKDRDTGRNPIFDVMLVLLNMDIPRVDTPNVNIKPFSLEGKTAKFDLNLSAIETGNQLFFSLEYSTVIFKEKTILKIIDYFKRLVHTVTSNPDMLLSQIELMGKEEKEKILTWCHGVQEADDEIFTIHQLFEEQVEQTPDYIAVLGPLPVKYRTYRTNMTNISYKELNRRANQLAWLLKEKGIKPNSVVGLMIPGSLEAVIGILAILKTGGAYLPIDPQYPVNRIEYMLRDSRVTILLTAGNPGERPSLSYTETDNIELQSLDIGEPGIYNRDEVNLPHLNNGSHLLYIIYTSGSTGGPKGVMLEHRNLVNLMTYQYRYTDLDFTRVTQFASISFDVSFQEIFSTLLAGGVLYMLDKRTKTDIPELCRIIRENDIRTVFFPISFIKAIFNDENYAALFSPRIRHIVCAGEQMMIIDRFKTYLKENNVHLHNHYGPSETHVVTTLTLNPGSKIPRLPSIGKPISNTSIYILDKAFQLQPPGIAGELYASGTALGRGYLNNPELTAQKFQSNFMFYRSYRSYKPYRTGDLARWLPEGNIEFLGRIDYQVKIRGFRVEPGEIEHRLMNVPGIKEAVVIDRNSAAGVKHLCAYIVSTHETPAISELRDHLSRSLPDYMIPAYFVPLEKIPLTPSGKVDKKALPTPKLKSSKDHIPPRNEIEKKLLGICLAVLGQDEHTPIGSDDNLFEWGANSLNIISIVSEIYKEFEIEIPIMGIFQHPRISEISRFIIDRKYISKEEMPAIILNPSKPQTLFCFPPGVGYGIAYIGLAKYLEDYTLYCFNFLEHDQRLDKYIELITGHQPCGPYRLFAFSAGGELAMEVANRLEQQGHEVSDIILLDCYRTTSHWQASTLKEFLDVVLQSLEAMGIEFLKDKVTQKINQYTLYLRNLSLVPSNAGIHLVTAEDRKERESRYLPGKQKKQNKDPISIDWAELTRGNCTTYNGFGLHVQMLADQYIERNAAIIKGILTGVPSLFPGEEAVEAVPFVLPEDVREAHQTLSNYSVKFLEFIFRDPRRLQRSNYQALVTHDPFFALTPWPTFVNRQVQKEIRRAASPVCQLVKQVPGRIFGEDTEAMSQYYEIPEAMIKTQLNGVTHQFINGLMARGDFVLTASGFKCIEYNVSANIGGLQVPDWEALYLENPIISQFLEENHIKIKNKNLLSIFLEHVVKTARESLFHVHDQLNTAIVFPGFTKSPNPNTAESVLNQLYTQSLHQVDKRLSGRIIFCDFSHLKVSEDTLYYNDTPIHTLVEMYGGVVPPEILELFKVNRINLFNGAITGLLSNKLNLALLSENQDSALFSQEEKEIIRTYIPWTRKTLDSQTTYKGDNINLVEFIRGNKDKLVLKPAIGYGGERIYIGKNTSRQEWENALRQAINERKWLVQEHVQSLPLLYQFGEAGVEPHQAIWGFFVFGDTYGGGCIRILPQSNEKGIVNAQQGAVSSVIFEVETQNLASPQ